MNYVKHAPRLLVALGVAVVLVCTEPQSPVLGDIDTYNLAVTGLTATYDPSTGLVNCSWQPPARQPAFYRLYRGLAAGSVQAVQMVSEGARAAIPGSATSFADIVGLENALYYYQLRAAIISKIDTTVYDNGIAIDTQYVEGPASARVLCRVGTGISFSINDGDLFTVHDTCHLTLLDATHFSDPAHSIDSAVFFDSTNTLTVQVTDTLQRFPWTLPKGPGLKVVNAILKHFDGHVDTVKYGIGIAPYRLEFKLRNETREPNESMKVWYASDQKGEMSSVQNRQVNICSVYKPWVDFGISISQDSSFDTGFDFWLAFPDTTAYLFNYNRFNYGTDSLTPAGDIVRSGCIHQDGQWWHTRPYHAELTGIGPAHDDKYLYHYGFAPDAAAGSQDSVNLSQLYIESKDSAATKIKITKIAGNSSRQNFALLISKMSAGLRRNFGKREFAIIGRFKGRYFGEDRIVISSARLDQYQPLISYYDAYPPILYRDAFEFYYLGDGATISGSMCIDLNSAGNAYDVDSLGDSTLDQGRGYIWDKGGAQVTSIDLYVASMPDAMLSTWNFKTSPGTITLAQLDSLPHRVFPYEITQKSNIIYPVRWCPIDPSGWATGWYLIAVVASDKYGNRDICPFAEAANATQATNTNPQHWQIVTGSVGL